MYIRLACSKLISPPSKKSMSMSILKFLPFILVHIPLLHSFDVNCPNSDCGYNQLLSLRYPFKLEGQQPHICSKYIDLKCSPQNHTILNLPLSGDFYVSDILYYRKSISLYDPQDCLAKRLMNLDLSSSPFAALQSESYTFYSCPMTATLFIDGFTPIECLSGAGVVTVASSSALPPEMKKSYGCDTHVTVDIPVEQAHQFDGLGDFSNFVLKWDAPSCKECEDDLNGDEGDGSPSTISRYIGLIILLCLWCFGCFLRPILSRCSPNRTAASTTTEEVDMAPQTTTTAGAVLPQYTIDECYVKTMTISTFLEGDFGPLQANDKGNSCSICLDEYSPQDTIRCLTVCYHYFHANCIDLWFQKNSSCPICRTSILDIL